MPVDVTDNYIRVRVKNPALFDPATYRTVQMTSGIKYIAGKLKGKKNGSMVIQTFLFDKNKFDKSSAVKWVKNHGYTIEGETKEAKIPKSKYAAFRYKSIIGDNWYTLFSTRIDTPYPKTLTAHFPSNGVIAGKLIEVTGTKTSEDEYEVFYDITDIKVVSAKSVINKRI